jgi:hypothetical protein
MGGTICMLTYIASSRPGVLFKYEHLLTITNNGQSRRTRHPLSALRNLGAREKHRLESELLDVEVEVCFAGSHLDDMRAQITSSDSTTAWENEGGAVSAPASACHRGAQRLMSWIVPSTVLPLAFVVLVAAYALYRAYS